MPQYANTHHFIRTYLPIKTTSIIEETRLNTPFPNNVVPNKQLLSKDAQTNPALTLERAEVLTLVKYAASTTTDINDDNTTEGAEE